MDSRSPADEVLLSAVRMAMAVSVRAADRIGAISPVQLRALTVLQQLPGANLSQFTEAMGVTASTTSRLADRLVAAGLIGRRPSPATRREISLSLTPLGREVLLRYDELRLQGMRDCLSRLPPGDVAVVIDALSLMAARSSAQELAVIADRQS